MPRGLTRRLEGAPALALALGLALGLHGAALALIGQGGAKGAVASGDGGQDLVTLAPVGGELAALVDAWEAPPEVAPIVPDIAAPDPAPPPDVSPPDVSPPDNPAEATVAPSLPVPPAVPVLPSASLSPPASMPPPPPLDAAPPPEAQPAALPSPDLRPKPRPQRAADPKPAPKPKPEPEPQAESAPAPSAQASGAGDGGAAGQAGQAAAGTAGNAGLEDALAAWGADIRARIERKKTYPRGAGGATGSVTLILTVTAAGGLASVTVATSSGHAVLDAAAVKAVKAARLPKGPPGVAEHSFRFRLRYER